MGHPIPQHRNKRGRCREAGGRHGRGRRWAGQLPGVPQLVQVANGGGCGVLIIDNDMS